jgi:alkanesulfonate monooxygenase SsuD/methylene tetrahydromethanopterin reductase-like flavin-dependent oxidoreductase (luciferase family)
MQWVAERRYDYLSVYAPSRVIKIWFDMFRAAAAACGYTPPEEKIGLLLPIYVAQSDQRAHDEARPHLEWLFHRGLKITPELYFPPGYLSDGSFRGLLSSGMKPFHLLSYDELLDLGHAIVGSPTTVRDKLKAMKAYLGFGNLCALLQFGDMPHSRAINNMELFASEVMPAFERSGASTRQLQAAG